MKRDFRIIFSIVQALLEAPYRAKPITELPDVPSDAFQHAAWLLQSQGYVLADYVSTGYQVKALTWAGYDYADQHVSYLKKLAADRQKKPINPEETE